MFMDVDASTIHQRVRQAGVVGAGGAGFPTYVKLKAQAEIYLANGAECEPLLKVDQQLAVLNAQQLVRGLQYAMKATGATRGIITLKAKYSKVFDILKPLLPANIELCTLPDIYPAGDEVITIWFATGRRVPAAALPASVGVVVNNIQTLINIAKAVEDQHPVIDRTLTINGAVKNPVTLTLPLGTPLRHALELAGGCTIDNPAYINGGPMMGQLISSLDQPITKTTGGLLVLPENHIVIKTRKQSVKTVFAMAKTVCEQCGLCTDLCPRHMIGHELSPHLIVRGVNYQQAANPSTLLAALTCSECGVCEAYACPVGISPMRLNKELKQQFRAQGARYEGELRAADPMANYRLLPTSRLVSRLDLTSYNRDAPLVETKEHELPASVNLLLRQHIGAVTKPVVKMGDFVERGALIANIDEDALGVPVHASISGRVTLIDEQQIIISRE